MARRMNKWQKGELAMYEAIKANTDQFKDLKYVNDKGDDRKVYDSFSECSFLEFKNRGNDNVYDSQLLERSKGLNLMKLAGSCGKKAYYVSYAAGKFYFYNLLKMYFDSYKFEWFDKELPTTSHFKDTSVRYKRVCYLPNEDAEFVLECMI